MQANELEHEAMEHAEQISELMTKLDEQMRLNTDLRTEIDALKVCEVGVLLRSTETAERIKATQE